MPRFSLKLFLFTVTCLGVCLPLAYRYYVYHYGSAGMSSVVRNTDKPYAGFRRVVLYNVASSEPQIVAIEKNDTPSTDRDILPSFCRLELSPRTARLFIGNRLVLPTNELVAYFSESGGRVSRTSLDREAYRKITRWGIVPAHDQQLWKLCKESEHGN